MRLTAAEQLALRVIDEVVAEPSGGAHEHPEDTAKNLRARIVFHLDTLAGRDRRALLEARYLRYRRMGEYATVTPAGEARPERGGWAELNLLTTPTCRCGRTCDDERGGRGRDG